MHPKRIPETGAGAADAPARHTGERLAGRLAGEAWVATLGAALVAAVFLVVVLGYWVPANQGPDENAYLVAGRNLAENGTAAIAAADPYTFAGRMWIKAADGRYHPKYPLGLPLLVAALWKLAAGHFAVSLAHLISPLALAAALLGVFALGREVADAAVGLLAELLLASAPLSLDLAIDPGSHALDLAIVTWGIVLLLRWERRGGAGLALATGALLGYAAIVRYTDALLALPAAIVLWRRRSQPGWRREVALLAAAGLLPLALQLADNVHVFGALTGYAATRESTAFSWHDLWSNADDTLAQIAQYALPVTLPFAALGLAWAGALRRGARTVLAAWVLPSAAVYTAYYYGPDNGELAYARFFLVVMPPLAIAAACALVQVARQATALRLASAAIVLLSAVQGASAARPFLVADRDEAEAARAAERQLLSLAPPGSVVFAPWELLDHLQLVGDYRFYSSDEFNRLWVKRLARRGDAPDGRQPERVQALWALMRGKDDHELDRLQRSLAVAGLLAGGRVFAIASATAEEGRAHLPALGPGADGWTLAAAELVRWTDPGAHPDDRAASGLARGWKLIEIRGAGPRAAVSRRAAPPG